jgi:hypothetical protein
VCSCIQVWLWTLWPCPIKIISSGDPAKMFSHSSLVIDISGTPPIKLKRGAYICRALLIANHLDQSLWCPIRNTEWKSRHIFYSLFGRWTIVAAAPFYCAIMLKANGFAEPNRHILTFLHPILLCTITYLAPLEMHLNINFNYPISIVSYFFTSVCLL